MFVLAQRRLRRVSPEETSGSFYCCNLKLPLVLLKTVEQAEVLKNSLAGTPRGPTLGKMKVLLSVDRVMVELC